MTAKEIKRLLEGVENISSFMDKYDRLLRSGKSSLISANNDIDDDDDDSGEDGKSKKDKRTFGEKLSDSYQQIQRINDAWARADKAASNYVKTVGMAAEGMNKLRQQTLRAMTSEHIGINFNVSTEELLEAQQNYVKGVGRTIRVNKEAQGSLAAMHAVFGGAENDLAVAFEKFGIGLEATGDHLGKLYADASKTGISLSAYASNVQKGLAMAQTYTFRDGVKGMEAMAKRAAAIHMDMEQVARLADKTNSVEGSITTAAKLQVLGGPYAAMADPLGMLNESLNDIGGLEKRIERMTANVGRFNRATGEVEISGFERQRLRAAAEATGMDYSKLIEQAQRQAQRGEVEAQIKSSATARGLSKEMQELIVNSASFKEGKAGVSINGEWRSVDQLREKDFKELVNETKTESEDIKDIARNVRSLVDSREGIKKQIDVSQARLTTASAKSEKGILNWLSSSNAFTYAMAGAGMAGTGRQIYRIFKNKGGGSVGADNAIEGNGRVIRNLFKKGGQQTAKTTAQTAASSTATSAVKSRVVKGGLKRTAKRAAIKTVGKSAAARLGAAAAKGGGIGSLFAVAGEIGNILTDNAIEKGKMKKGSAGHTAAKMASQAATWGGMGAAIGSAVPVIGTAVGAVVGAIGGATVGLIQAKKAKAENILDAQLQSMDITREGKYSRKKLNDIDEALNTGKMSNKLRRKLIQQGDMEIVNKIKEVKKGKDEEAENAKKTINNAKFNVRNASFNGVALGSLAPSIFGGASNAVIRGKQLDGNVTDRIRRGKTNESDAGNRKSALTEGVKVDISGTIKLEGANGKSVEITDELLKNRAFINSITELVSKRMNVVEHGDYVPSKFLGPLS